MIDMMTILLKGIFLFYNIDHALFFLLGKYLGFFMKKIKFSFKKLHFKQFYYCVVSGDGKIHSKKEETKNNLLHKIIIII